MREVIAEVDRWLEQGDGVALATVIQTWGSAPRKAGAKMAMTPAGAICGSVSGGCIEGAVYEQAMIALAAGEGQLLSFGVADETAWDVGLACGGQIQVLVQGLDPAGYQAIRHLLANEQPGAIATIIAGPAGTVGQYLVITAQGVAAGNMTADWQPVALPLAQQALLTGRTARHSLENGELFIEVLAPSPLLVIVGGVHIAIALASLSKILGYHTIVIDPRRAFGSQARFPHADQLIQSWPDKAFQQVSLHQATAIVMLTHDPKIDDPALKIALNSPAFYIGALGSKNTHAKRCQRLLAAGLSQAQIARIHGPIGLPINAQTPEEIAVAILAEMIQSKT